SRSVLLSLPAPALIYTLSLHDALPISANLFSLIGEAGERLGLGNVQISDVAMATAAVAAALTSDSADGPDLDLAEISIELETLRSEEHTSELQSREKRVCRLRLEKEIL